MFVAELFITPIRTPSAALNVALNVHACTHELGVIRLLDARGGTANDAAANSFLKDAVEADSEAFRSTSQTN